PLTIERGRQVDQPEELGTIAIGIAATMRTRELGRRFPRRVPLEWRLSQQHTELGDGGGESQIVLELGLLVGNGDGQETARISVGILVPHLDGHQLAGSRAGSGRGGVILYRIPRGGGGLFC